MSLRTVFSSRRSVSDRRKRTALKFVPAIQGLEDRKLLSNSPPVAGGGSVSTLHDHAVSGSLYAYDMDGSQVTVKQDSGPSNGTLTLDGSGSFTYTPNQGYVGQDSFTFDASDQNGTSDTATETINVTNQAPLVDDGRVSTLHDHPVSGSLYAYDMDGDQTTISQVSGPSNGTLTLDSSGSFTYTPNQGYVGQDSFTFKANDGITDSITATETIDVTDNAPTAGEVDASVFSTPYEPGTVAINLLSSAYDMDGDPVSLVSYGSPQNGTLTSAGNGVVIYTPNNTPFIGVDTFTYTVTDGIMVAMAQVKVNVANVSVVVALKDSGQIVPAPENSAFQADLNTSGVNKLGPLDMGLGRPNDPNMKNGAYANAFMIIGTVTPGGTKTTDNGITFSWNRVSSARGWNIDKEVDGANNPVWAVTENYQYGLKTFQPDHSTTQFDDNTPSDPGGQIYTYDDPSANMYRYSATLTGGFMMEERIFTYTVYASMGGQTKVAGRLTISQIIQAKRVQKGGGVPAQWMGVKNTVVEGTNTRVITEQDVRTLVGQDSVPIDVSVANPPAQ